MVGRVAERVNVRVYVAAETSRPESKAPSSAVTVCVRTLSFVHVTVSPRSTSRCGGVTAAKPMLTGTAAPRAALARRVLRARRRRGRRERGTDDARRARARRRIAASPGRCRSSRAPCAPRRGSGRATCPDPPRASGSRNDSAGPTVCGVARAAVGRQPAVAVDVEACGARSPSPSRPTARGRRPASGRPACCRRTRGRRSSGSRPSRVKTTTNSRSGRALVPPEDREHPVHAAHDRVVHRRRVVVVRPHARPSRAAPCSL